MKEHGHQSVLMDEAIEQLSLQSDDVVVDATIGGAGHFSALLSRLGKEGVLVGIDADEEAVRRGEEAASGARARVYVAHDNFRNLGRVLDSFHITKVDKVLFDLGWSSYHLSSGRGFSFQSDEPLHMTYGTPKAGKTAADIVNLASEEALADMLCALGEERFARSIARSIVEARSVSPITTTQELVSAVRGGTPLWYQRRRIHPATKTFQALRIAVNDELGALREGLGTAIERLNDGGRIAVISFHSIEDRIVKMMLKEKAQDGTGTLITKKPVVPTRTELLANPRARSAKLRVFQKEVTGRSTAPSVSHFTYA